MLDRERRQQLATRYQLKILTLSPIHVGSGAEDLMPVAGDVISDGKGHLVVVDLRKLAPPWLTDAEFDDLIAGGRTLRNILQGMDAQRLQTLAAYKLPQPSGRVKRIVQQTKTRRSEPYLPGSTIKGAIRTALAWAIFRQEDIHTGVNYVEDRGRFSETVADDLLDAEIFRPVADEANYDLLRALQIGDSGSDKKLGLSQVAVYSTRGNKLVPKSFRLHVETILPNRELTATARLDRYLLNSPEAQEILHFELRRSYLENFISHVNDLAEMLIDHEIKFFGKYTATDVLHFYDTLKETLQEVKRSGNTCLLYLGWGPGWIAKTIGSALDKETVDQVRSSFDRMGRKGFPLFPKSRRLIEKNDRPSAPLGWLAAVFREARG